MSPFAQYAVFWLLQGALAASILGLLFWPKLLAPGQRRRGAALWLGCVALAVLGYAAVGAPGLMRQWQIAAADRVAAEAEIETLDARTKVEPKDAAAWAALGTAQMRAGNAHGAVVSYKQETLLTQGDPDALLRLGKAQVLAARGRVPEDAAKTFTILQTIRPDPQAELFIAMHEAETGAKDQAMRRLSILVQDPATSLDVRNAANEQMKRLK